MFCWCNGIALTTFLAFWFLKLHFWGLVCYDRLPRYRLPVKLPTRAEYLKRFYISVDFVKEVFDFFFLLSSSKTISFLFVVRWPITFTAITKRNTVNKEILINKKKFCSHLKKVCSHRKKFWLHTQNKPTANSHDIQLRQIPTANSHGKFPRQKATANSCGKSPTQKAMTNSCRKVPPQVATSNSYGKLSRQITITNICKVPTILLRTHFKQEVSCFMF